VEERKIIENVVEKRFSYRFLTVLSLDNAAHSEILKLLRIFTKVDLMSDNMIISSWLSQSFSL